MERHVRIRRDSGLPEDLLETARRTPGRMPSSRWKIQQKVSQWHALEARQRHTSTKQDFRPGTGCLDVLKSSRNDPDITDKSEFLSDLGNTMHKGGISRSRLGRNLFLLFRPWKRLNTNRELQGLMCLSGGVPASFCCSKIWTESAPESLIVFTWLSVTVRFLCFFAVKLFFPVRHYQRAMNDRDSRDVHSLWNGSRDELRERNQVFSGLKGGQREGCHEFACMVWWNFWDVLCQKNQ